MANEKLGQVPAFASSYDEHTGFDSLGNKEYTRINELGMSKRFYAATQILSSIVKNEKLRLEWKGVIQDDYKEFNKMIVSQAYTLADELLKQENHE